MQHYFVSFIGYYSDDLPNSTGTFLQLHQKLNCKRLEEKMEEIKKQKDFQRIFICAVSYLGEFEDE